jgi:hypothetical protein
MEDLSTAYTNAGRHMEALRLTEKVLESRKNKLGEDHIKTLESMKDLALCLRKA